MQEEWDLADQRELYEVQWTLFSSEKNPHENITYSDVPWPGISTSPSQILQVLLYGTLVRLLIQAASSSRVVYCQYRVVTSCACQ